MERVPQFKNPQDRDEGWISVKVKVRPGVLAALKKEAHRETQELRRRVYVSDLVRDGIRLLCIARRLDTRPRAKSAPAVTKQKGRRFQPSALSLADDG